MKILQQGGTAMCALFMYLLHLLEATKILTTMNTTIIKATMIDMIIAARKQKIINT